MDRRTSLALILSSFLGLSNGFLGLGGSESNAKVQFHKGSQFGFEKDPNVYAHFVIPPWNRPFKPGYCLSWEWHTDKKYRDKRVAICKQHNEGKHECDSESGFCPDKCPYTNGSYPYWRIRNAADVPFLWVVSGIKFYDTPTSTKALNAEPKRGYASSYFGPGYAPSMAFDNNPESLWISNGAAPPGMQWIAYEFPYPVFVGSVHIASEEDKPDRMPSLIVSKRYNVFSMAKFTTLGATGRLGPTSVGTYYQGQDHEGQVTVNKGIQMWKIPATGMYTIEAAGAAGGNDKFTSSSKRGKGARVKGNFHLKRGDVLKILVGQEGGVNSVSGGAGGGGGSLVVNDDNTALLIAGGGGGVDKMKGESPRCQGSGTSDGNAGYGGSQFQGGTGGKGAEEGDNNYSGGGGGGFETNGRSNQNFGGAKGTGGEGGKSFYKGGVGGRSNQNEVEGGFGGGGGPNGAGGGGGGGGGYSGGASGSRSNSCGGGGGSYNSGKEQSNQAGSNNGAGYVIIKLLNVR
ncbi:hypothetical protein AWC38_SpisGene16737 [Stylophora pistillata]|uniref:Uncharacterized protein n=1 Tax=Stylophora pistillata TaxID=50429 RepID=A0A2B4RRC9_STYPI|nr:hypothetical protein AWC38_SpisGene16737 [Stylophora pistillata]